MVFARNTIPEVSRTYRIDSMLNIANKQIRQLISMHIRSNKLIAQLWRRSFVDSTREWYLMRPTQKNLSIARHYCVLFQLKTR